MLGQRASIACCIAVELWRCVGILTMLDRKKLARLCEMFRSPYECERAAAAMHATELLERAGLTWTEFIGRSQEDPAPSIPTRTVRPRASWSRPDCERILKWRGLDSQILVDTLESHARHLSAWQIRFVRAIRAQRPERGLTMAQWQALARILSDRCPDRGR